ncbi:serine/threonine-protein kinase bud32 [Orbilia brochopaga]|uniref:EKC/KEOPS complex subunit BUD32 n=1 Tax=Orbilia brochopaga TaxID=3140254 RepID=A0AAV9U6U5_9PEZI
MSRRSIDGTLIKQGAEAHVYKSTFLLPTVPSLIKVRPRKAYRHATLDLRLTKHRCVSEARLLNRCRTMGVPCPAVYFVDERNGEITMEWIEGPSIRELLQRLIDGSRDKRSEGEEEGEGEGESDVLSDSRVLDLMRQIGETVGKLHDIDIIHGDLTTSNLMLRKERRTTLETNSSENTETESNDGGIELLQGNYEVVLIDFGLGQVSVSDEDKAVDLYVLERAFISTHPKASGLFHTILEAYKKNSLGSGIVLRRLQEVRLRGRKKSMIG